LTFGKKSPWDNFHMWVPKFVAKWFMNKPKKYCMPDNINTKAEHIEYVLAIHGISIGKMLKKAYNDGYWDGHGNHKSQPTEVTDLIIERWLNVL